MVILLKKGAYKKFHKVNNQIRNVASRLSQIQRLLSEFPSSNRDLKIERISSQVMKELLGWQGKKSLRDKFMYRFSCSWQELSLGWVR